MDGLFEILFTNAADARFESMPNGYYVDVGERDDKLN